MKKHWLNILFYVVLAAAIVFFAWKLIFLPIYQSYQWNKQDASYAVTQAFSQYEDVLFDRMELNQKIEKAPEDQKAQLRQEIPALDKKMEKRTKELDAAFSKIKKYYPHNALIEERIHAFQKWRSQSKKQVMQSIHSDWDLPFLKLQMGVTRAIDKAQTGYEDPTQAENDKIMSLVPAAEQALKKHPNDKELCTVMQQPLNPLSHNLRLTAQQIAFFNVGDQYCPRYYADSAAWGGWGTKARVMMPMPSFPGRPAYPAEKLTDEEWNKGHPEQYVLPLIPNAIEVLKNPKKNEDICVAGALSAGPRNPEQDAKRAAFVQMGKKYCPANTLEQGYYATGVACLMICDGLCPEGMVCDCVERCKKTPGVLFKEDSDRS